MFETEKWFVLQTTANETTAFKESSAVKMMKYERRVNMCQNKM